MTSTKKTFRRVIAGAGVVALAMAGVLVSAGAASAAVGPGPDQPGHPATGSLTINKYKGQPTANPSDADRLSGVQFIVTQVGRTSGGACVPLDLSQAAAWDGVQTLFPSAAGAQVPSPIPAPFCLTSNVYDRTTDGNGQISLTGLPLSIYFVHEGLDNGNNNIVSKVPDFYVSVPTSLGAAAGWEYDVVVDPKNAVMNQPTKTIDANQQQFVVGQNVTWNLTVPIPQLNNGETFNQALVTDVLDPRLTYVSATAAIDGTPTTDFTYANGVWTFGDAARTLMNGAMGKNLTISFVTQVTSVGNGSIPNNNYSSTFNGTTVPGGPVPYTYWGQLNIQKNDNSTPVRALKGAEFKVFNVANAQGQCPADAPTSGAVATGLSNDAGVVEWAGATPTSPLGLWVANTQQEDANVTKVYCVYETVVPAGHTAVPFSPAVTIKPGVDNTVTLTVTNDKQQGPNLPLTGGTGSWALMFGGLALAGGGVAFLTISRRRRHSSVD